MNILKQINSERLIHSIKTAIACLVGVLLAKGLGFSVDQWIVVTIVVVMCAQIYVGSVIQKAYFRFIGTVIGTLFAMTSLVLTGDNFLGILLTMAFSGFFFSYLATSGENWAYAGTLGATTTAIILLSATHTIDFAMLRFTEISCGILIATLVSQFVLPIHARSHILRSQVEILTQLKNYYGACCEFNPPQSKEELEEIESSIIFSLAKQRQLAKEAGREPLGNPFDQKIFIQVLQCEKEILRAIHFMHLALKKVAMVNNSKNLPLFNQQILTAFDNIIRLLTEDENKITPLQLIAPNHFFMQFNSEQMQGEEMISFDTFLFTAETLTHNLKKLASLHHIDLIIES